MYSSRAASRLYQTKPIFNKPSQFKAKGWTDTVEGFQHEANKLTRCILRNRQLAKSPYTWHVTINIEIIHTPKQVSDEWTKIVRNLRRKGIVALWVREPTKSGKVHYHLILRNVIGKAQLVKTVKQAMFDEKKNGKKRCGWHMKVKAVDDDWEIAHYITKAKKPGYHDRKKVDDYYAPKRLLFKAGLKIKKYGEIGDFWVKPKKQIWLAIIDVEKRIGEGLEQPNIKRLCKYVFDFLGGGVPLKDIERAYGFHAESDGVQGWIQTLLTTEWADEDR